MSQHRLQHDGHQFIGTVHDVRLEPRPGRDPRVSLRVAMVSASGASAGWYPVAPAFAPELWMLHEDHRVVGRRWTLRLDADDCVSALHEIP